MALLLSALMFAALPPSAVLAQQPKGEFLTPLRLQNIPGKGHEFSLDRDFSYRDASGRLWTAPKNAVVDGASIPRPLWIIVGSPWGGLYKEASVIHDHFCRTKSRPWQEVHGVFYEAMLANGVDPALALIMYAAVYRFGPRWTTTESSFRACTRQIALRRRVSVADINSMCHGGGFDGKGHIDWSPALDDRDLEALRQAASSGKSRSEIEAMVQRQVAADPDVDLLRSYRLLE